MVPGHADERILRFVSDVTVEKDSSLDVVETIGLLSEGVQIRHGILRDFPTDYTDAQGGNVVAGFSVQSVTRDGQAEPYSIEVISNGRRVRIGSPDTILAQGPHEYVIRYRTTRQIGFFANYDELYWNATGNGWTLPIDQAETRITLPESATFTNQALYTGPQGAKGHDARIVSNHPGEIIFRTTQTLPPGSGLTVAASWPKGIIVSPKVSQRAAWWVEDNLGAIFSVLGVVAVLSFFANAWNRVGRDPDRGTIIPLFAPPDNLSAAATRYIAEMDFDNRVFSAAILDLGVRRHVVLSDVGKHLKIERKPAGQPTDAAETALETELFRDQPALEMVPANHQRFAAAKSALQRELATAYAGKIFNWNAGWLAIGVVMTVGAYILTAIGFSVALGGDRAAAAMVGLVLASIAVIALGVGVQANGRSVGLFVRLFGWLFALIFAAGFAFSGVTSFLAAVHSRLDMIGLALPFVVMPILVSAFTWMRSPTPEGQRLRDQIAGFKQYLGIAEEHRLEVLHPPEKTPELFERYLPYAVALDVENSWAARFSDILAAAGATAAVSAWYLSSSDRSASGLVGRLGAELSVAAASASAAPGSSSGSGGGGSSGGGGGGGGGSGW